MINDKFFVIDVESIEHTNCDIYKTISPKKCLLEHSDPKEAVNKVLEEKRGSYNSKKCW